MHGKLNVYLVSVVCLLFCGWVCSVFVTFSVVEDSMAWLWDEGQWYWAGLRCPLSPFALDAFEGAESPQQVFCRRVLGARVPQVPNLLEP